MPLFFRNFGEGSESEGTLDLAHVVLEDRLRREGLSQVEAVLDLQRLTNWPLLGTRAHGTRGNSLGVPDLYPHVAHVAGDSLLPQVEVDGGKRRAGDPGVEEGVGHVEHGSLDVRDLVAVVAGDLGEGSLPDLVELRLGEAEEGVAALVPEPVALPQVPELDADDAGEGGTHQPTVERGLG